MEEKVKTEEVKTEPVEKKKKREPHPFFVYVKDRLMKTTNGMAIGLFGTLIIGTIIALLAKIPGLEIINTWAKYIQGLMGAGIGLGVALALKRQGVTVVAAMVAGFIGNYAFNWVFPICLDTTSADFSIKLISDPLSCYISVCLALLTIKYVMRKKTPVDLILIPLVGCVVSVLYSFLLANWIHYITLGIGYLVEISFDVIPVIMCMIISGLVGIALTAPISSVAICVAIHIGNVPLAACAALIGCCTQMVGFAVHTAHDNKWGSVLAVGLGTSMLQFKNIVRKPLIWLPTIIVSVLIGPLAMIFPIEGMSFGESALSVGAGMGTSGLVGPLNFLGEFNYNWVVILEIIGFCILVPGILVFVADFIFRKVGWIKKGDFSLSSEL